MGAQQSASDKPRRGATKAKSRNDEGSQRGGSTMLKRNLSSDERPPALVGTSATDKRPSARPEGPEHVPSCSTVGTPVGSDKGWSDGSGRNSRVPTPGSGRNTPRGTGTTSALKKSPSHGASNDSFASAASGSTPAMQRSAASAPSPNRLPGPAGGGKAKERVVWRVNIKPVKAADASPGFRVGQNVSGPTPGLRPSATLAQASPATSNKSPDPTGFSSRSDDGQWPQRHSADRVDPLHHLNAAGHRSPLGGANAGLDTRTPPRPPPGNGHRPTASSETLSLFAAPRSPPYADQRAAAAALLSPTFRRDTSLPACGEDDERVVEDVYDPVPADVAPDNFRAAMASHYVEGGYGWAEVMSCGKLPEDFAPIRPSRLGLCPGRMASTPAVTRMTGKRGMDGREGVEVDIEEASMEVEGQSVVDAVKSGAEAMCSDETPNGSDACNTLLNSFLDVCESTFGFIAATCTMPDGSFCLKTHAISNILWTDKLRAWLSQHSASGLVFTDVSETGLFGRAALSGEAAWLTDAVAGEELPKGHPNVNSALAVPLVCGRHVIGVAVAANRIGGYSEFLLHAIQPLVTAISSAVFAIHWQAAGGVNLRKQLPCLAQDGTVAVNASGKVVSMDPVARAIFGFSPLWPSLTGSSAQPNNSGEGATGDSGRLEFKGLTIWDLLHRIGEEEMQNETIEALAELLEEPQAAVGIQQGGCPILLEVHLPKGKAAACQLDEGEGEGEGGGPVVEATVRLLAGTR